MLLHPSHASATGNACLVKGNGSAKHLHCFDYQCKWVSQNRVHTRGSFIPAAWTLYDLGSVPLRLCTTCVQLEPFVVPVCRLSLLLGLCVTETLCHLAPVRTIYGTIWKDTPATWALCHLSPVSTICGNDWQEIRH